MHIVDSAIVRSQIQKESYGFGTFTATKIAEIQSKSSPEEWWWISGGQNPADMVSRSALPKDLAENSVWQCGPSFLSAPFELWPVKKDPVKDLPDRLKVYAVQIKPVEVSLGNIFDLSQYSSTSTQKQVHNLFFMNNSIYLQIKTNYRFAFTMAQYLC